MLHSLTAVGRQPVPDTLACLVKRKALHALTILLLAANACVSNAKEPPDLLRTWQGIPGLERTSKGRLYVSWFSGGRQEPAVENTVYLKRSDDGGHTFSQPQPMAGPLHGSRCYDPTLWLDPTGRLWFIFNRSNRETAAHGVYARLCEAPDAPEPVWTPEFRVGFDETPFSFRMNKPTVLQNGTWVLPVTHASATTKSWGAGAQQLQGAAVSNDKGKTWKLHGAIKAPEWALENMIIELRDGRLWMLIRTDSGVLWESHSADKGITWSEAKASSIPSPGSRFFIRRLASGNLLLVNHYKFKGRSHLTARISDDEGANWNEGLLLDERANVSYPDGIEDKNGVIWMVHDRERYAQSEILLSTFKEEDVRAGKDVTGKVRLKQTIEEIRRPLVASADVKLLPPEWDPKAEADAVMGRLVSVTATEVKGAHDAEMAFVGSHAYIVAEVNDVKAGEGADWPFIYSTLSVVNIHKLTTETIIPIAKGEDVFENETLPTGSIFVPRILRLNDTTLRCFFASEAPGKRQAKTWFRDFDVATRAFEKAIHPVKLKTAAGTFDMEPQYFHADAARVGFEKRARDFGLYIFDSFKVFGGRTYAALNNYPGEQNGLSVLNKASDTFEVLGHYNEPGKLRLTESAINQLPDGTWMAICRQEGGDSNYAFTTSKDGVTWTEAKHLPFVPNGASSKPTFDKFQNVYYLGWQEKTKINNVNRSVFNVDVSVDGEHWERKYRFETEHSFQYPTFRQHQGSIWVCVTQGDTDSSRKERIMFGRLE